MPTTVVDIADMAVSCDPTGILTTYSLGSCIGLTLWDPRTRVGGLLHFMLPDSQLCPARAKTNPAMFCDTGTPLLFRAACELGARLERLVVRAAGGAQLLDKSAAFDIGRRNYLALRKTLRASGVELQREDFGGTASRSLRLELTTGKLVMKSGEVETEL